MGVEGIKTRQVSELNRFAATVKKDPQINLPNNPDLLHLFIFLYFWQPYPLVIVNICLTAVIGKLREHADRYMTKSAGQETSRRKHSRSELVLEI